MAASSVLYTDFWGTSIGGMSDADYLETLVPCDELEPARKKPRHDYDHLLLHLNKNFIPFSYEIKGMEDALKEDESRENEDVSLTWNDFFQYMQNQGPGLLTEPVTFTSSIAEPGNTNGSSESSPKQRRGRKSLAQSNMVVRGNTVRYSCNICTKTFPTNRGLKIHIHTHKTLVVKTASYTSPKISSTRYQALTGHHELLVVHKPFVCPLCERGFSIKLDSLVHLVTEACTRADRSLRRITKGWECITCDKVYSSRDQAERHTRCHEYGRGMSCPICNKDFKGCKGNVLVNHVKNTHPEYFDNLGC